MSDIIRIKHSNEKQGPNNSDMRDNSCLASATGVQYTNVSSDEKLKFMMRIEAVFNLTGRGTVVVGRVLTGAFCIGDAVDIVISDGNRIATTIKEIEMYNKSLNQAQAGDNVGVFLCGVRKDDIRNATVFVNSNAKVLYKFFTGRIYVLRQDEGGMQIPVFNYYYPYFRFETSENRGLMTFEGEEAIEMLMPGDEGDIKVELDDYAVISPGMHFGIYEEGQIVAKGQISGVE